jgi:hypothetical protein
MAEGREAVNGALRPGRARGRIAEGAAAELALGRACRNKARMTLCPARLAALFAGLLAFQLTGACAEQVQHRLPTPQPRVAAEQPAPGPAVWKVADADTTIYLFGTVHALPDGTMWYKPHVEAAFEASNELVTEISMKDLDAVGSAMADKAYLPEGENLRDTMDQKDREDFEAALVSLGIPVATFDRYKPWAAAFYLSLLPVQQAGFEPDQGVDVKLTEMAGPNVKHTALETAAFQISLFDSLPKETQREYLREVVKSIPEIGSQIKQIAAAWIEGDSEKLAKVYQDDGTDPLLHQRLITDRNITWAKWISRRLERPGTVFVAVGAGHLVGQGSVEDQLEKLGIESKRVR